MARSKRYVMQTSIKVTGEEWQVCAYDQHGTRFPAADYFTDDEEDAKSTSADMLRRGLAMATAEEPEE